jgi:hypothetical protein
VDIDVLNGQGFLRYEKFLPDLLGIGQPVEVTFAKTPEPPGHELKSQHASESRSERYCL